MTGLLTTDWPLVARAGERAALLAALARGAGAGALVAGPAGVGKTSLVRSCLRPPPRGRTPVWVFGAASTAAVPLGAFIPVLPSLDATHPDRILHEAFTAFRTAARPGDPRASRPMLVVDDAHLLDDLSALLVHQLATTGRIPVVVTVRSGHLTPEPIGDLWKDGALTRIELGPLTADGVTELLEAVLDGPFDLDLAHRLARASGGNPLYLRELITAARDSGDLAPVGGAWRLTGGFAHSPRLAELVDARLGPLDRAAREALEILAVGEPLDLDHTTGLLDAGVLADLEDRGLIEVVGSDRGGAVHLAHPAYGEVLRSALPALRARRINRMLAEAVTSAGARTEHDRERIVRWQLAAGVTPTTADLLTAARGALLRFDVDLARRCAADAHAREPSEASAIAWAEALILSGENAAAEALTAAPGPRPPSPRAARLRASHLYHWLDEPEAARRVGAPALAHAWFDLYDGRPNLARPAASADAAEAADAAALGALAALAAGRLAHAAESAPGPAGSAAPAPIGGATEPGLHLVTGLLTLVAAGDLDGLDRAGPAVHRQALADGDAVTRGWAAYTLGTAALLRGRPRTAERWFREAALAMARAGGGPRAHAVGAGLAHAAALAGDPARAQTLLGDLDALPGRRWPLLADELARARAWTLAVGGSPRDAARILLDAAERARALGLGPAEAALLHDALRLGDRSALTRLVDLGGLVEGPLSAARAGHARALAARDHGGLRAAAGAFGALGAYLLAAEAAAQAAALADPLDARAAAALRRASREFVDRGEDPRSPALDAAGPPAGLTERELEIARLAAAGRTSKAIAEELCVSVRTVDNCLGRVFAKLGTRNRAELGAALGE